MSIRRPLSVEYLLSSGGWLMRSKTLVAVSWFFSCHEVRSWRQGHQCGIKVNFIMNQAITEFLQNHTELK